MKVLLFIPTYNAVKGGHWLELLNSIMTQTITPYKTIIVDSDSGDETTNIASDFSFNVVKIKKEEFNHGGTRNLAVKMAGDADIVVFLTQDAILNNANALERIIDVFINNDDIAAAYGRQLPHLNANHLATHARLFNYKEHSYVSEKNLIPTMGIKAAFISNSFSAYRISSFKELGCFPNNTILCEDMFFAAKLILAGYKIAYVSDAEVRHSHNYSCTEEFKRYFDIGVFHNDEKWIRESFGGAGGEGKKFIISELKYLLKNSPSSIPQAFISNGAKLLGYKFGQNYTKLPLKLRRALSMHKRYWDSVID
ncbi:glycosyltransferase family 2 protein [Serratia fonticola]|uniref:glycosyltransferase family 2 protein n=1 Tax=Serratia fonticola TaxID=47917 RepID=UPI0015C63CE2|nr:glycosyltransferase [Serratia fonticola]NYA45575.1 glycosyltransferase family 2 protein [Serratia fonticola]CAI0751390.1 N-glycosyltransferase [Serratia fonticola]